MTIEPVREGLHGCPAPGCDVVELELSRFACGAHYMALPEYLRGQIRRDEHHAILMTALWEWDRRPATRMRRPAPDAAQLMTDAPPEDVLAEATGEEPTTIADVVTALVPVRDQLRATLADIALLPIDRADPASRSRLVSLRQQLDSIARDTRTWVDAIDGSIRRAAVTLGAKEIPTADGVIRVERPKGEWKVDVPALKKELEELVAAGAVAQAELDAIITVVVTEKADNAKLNYLARNRGEEVQTAIDAHRTYVEGNPLGAKLTFVEKR